MSTVSVTRKCFVCSVEIKKAYFLSRIESSFMSCEILEIFSWTNDLQMIKFEKVCYCHECLNKILKVRHMTEELQKLEKDILQQKNQIKSQLLESCTESERNFIIDKDGQLQLPGIQQILQKEIITKLGRNSTQLTVGKIRQKEVDQKSDEHLSDKIQIMKNIVNWKISTCARESLGPEKSEKHSCHMNSVKFQFRLISNNHPGTQPQVERSTSLPVSDQPANQTSEMEHSKSKCLSLDSQNSIPTDKCVKETFAIPEENFSLRDNDTPQVLKEKRSLRSTAKRIIDFKKKSKFRVPEKSLGGDNLFKNNTERNEKSSTGENKNTITSMRKNAKNIFVSKNSNKRAVKQRKSSKSEFESGAHRCSQKVKVKRTRKSYHPARKIPKKCEECGIVLPSTDSWKEHMMYLHGTEARHKCTLCTYCTGYSSSLVEHMTIHSNDRNFKCHLCFKTFKFQRYLRCHMTSHEGDFQCKVCLIKFKYSISLARHEIKAHPEKKLKCDLCSKTFSTNKYNINNHMKIHGGKFQCKICLTTFNYEITLRKHEFKVHPVTKLKCDLCSKTFNTHAYVNKHMLIHGGKFQCKICLTTFNYERTRRRHEIKAHNFRRKRRNSNYSNDLLPHN